MSRYFKSGLLLATLFYSANLSAQDFNLSGSDIILDKIPTLTHNTHQLKPIPSSSYQLASTVFLPEVNNPGRDEADLGWNDKEYIKDNHNNGNNCTAYEFEKSNCTLNRSLYVPCPFNHLYYKKCYCNTEKYKYTRYGCKYIGTEHDVDYVLGNNRCYDDNAVPKSTTCECRNKFSYTNNASCGDIKKVIDTSSYCENDDEKRYEKCKCDPEKFPKTFNGNTSSQEFKNLIKEQCGHPDNFDSCDNSGPIVHYNCHFKVMVYKYSKDSCKAENAGYDVYGSSESFTNGNNKFVTLYTGCDCPSSFTTDKYCPGRRHMQFWSSSSSSAVPICYRFGHGLKDHTTLEYGYSCNDLFGGQALISTQSCTKRNGTEVYSPDNCQCNSAGISMDNTYRGQYDRNTESYACYSAWTKSSQWCAVCRTNVFYFSHRTAGADS